MRKRSFGPWAMPLLGLLAKMKGLRGTRFDLFGYTEERRTERALIGDYEALILRNHGVVITGASIEALFASVQRFMVACELQMQLVTSGVELVEIPEAQCK